MSEDRQSFEAFKSDVCHSVKRMGDIDFIINVIKDDAIHEYWDKKWYPEAFYILGMLDYLSRLNNVSSCSKYNEIRSFSLKQTIYPKDVEMCARLNKNLDWREECAREAIPEFKRFNIIESEVRNVC